jgi:hypothetical protein
MLTLINPVERAEPFDHADWIFEAKFDGFRAAADTVRGRLISRARQSHETLRGGAGPLTEGARVRRRGQSPSAVRIGAPRMIQMDQDTREPKFYMGNMWVNGGARHLDW